MSNHNASRFAPPNLDPLADLSYEIEMLVFAASRLARRREGWVSIGEHNVYVESFLVHARVLDEFFSARSRKDDVVARDFIATWPIAPILEARQRQAISKQLAHLTVARRQPFSFTFVQMTTGLVTAFAQFADAVIAATPPARERLQAGLEAARAWIGQPPSMGMTSTSIDALMMRDGS